MIKVARTVLTGVISVGLFSALTIGPAQAYTEHENPATPISLTGTPAVSKVLTLTKQTYTSFTERNFGVTWIRCTSAKSLENFKDAETDNLLSGCTIISQSKLLTYTVTANDVGKHISAVVNITDVVASVPPIQPTHSGYSMAQSLLITSTTNATPKKDPAFPKVATKLKVKKSFTIKLNSTKGTSVKGANADGLATVVTVTAASKKFCSVAKVVNKKSKKITGYTIKGLKAGKCSVVVAISGNSKFKAKSKTTAIAVSK